MSTETWQLHVGSGVKSVAVGWHHSCAVTSSGGVKCWGSNIKGQLGDGTTAGSLLPKDVVGLSSGVVAVSAGQYHSCALTAAGSVKCWGSKVEIGDGSGTDSSVPVGVSGLTGGVSAISSSDHHSCAITSSGGVVCWGRNSSGQLGNDTTVDAATPVPVFGLSTGVSAIATGPRNSCAIKTGGVLACWGGNTSGQLGNDSTVGSSIPIDVPAISPIVAVAIGQGHTCAAQTGGAAKCWGANEHGQLGNGSTIDSLVPLSVTSLGSDATVLSVGRDHSCALTATGSAWCWGASSYGQLGRGIQDQDTSPGLVWGYTGQLRVTTSPPLPSQIRVDGHVADTWGLEWVKQAPGIHQVCFSDVAGFATPPCQTVSIVRGETTTVTGTFVQRGYIHVSTSPPVASRISVDGIGRDNWGVYTDIATGSHQVCFGPVAGFAPPPCQVVSVSGGVTTPVTGTFTPAAAPGSTGVGLLRVTTSPSVPSQVILDGTIADRWGLNWLEVGPGSHTICFTDVRGYDTPACTAITVANGTTTTVSGTFVQRGYLNVVTSPAVAGTITVDGFPTDDWGMYTDLSPGSYHVCFGGVPGYIPASCVSMPVTAGATASWVGYFDPIVQ